MENKTKFNKHTKVGWVFTAFPTFVIFSFVFKKFEKEIFDVIGSAEVSVKYIFLLLGQVCMLPFNHVISIKYEAWILGGEMNSCLLNSLMGNNNKIEKAQMKKIRKKVYIDFGDRLPSKKEMATLNDKIIRKKLVPFVRNINDRMKDCKDVMRYRKGYVETRKLVSSNISAVFLTSLFCIYLSIVKEYSLFILFFGFLYIYISWLVANIYLLKWYGGKYTEVVLDKYLKGCSGTQEADKEVKV